MPNRSNSWLVPAAVVLLALSVSGCAEDADELSVQAVADLVSQSHYETYQLAIENMGLGLYGGPDYDMGYRNRDAFDDVGSLLRPRRERKREEGHEDEPPHATISPWWITVATWFTPWW